MKRHSIRALMASVLVLMLAVAGCGGSAGSAGSGKGETVKLGVLAAVTTDAALMGVEMKNGAYMAVEDFNAAGGINGQKVEIVFADSAMSDSVTVSAYNKVMASKPVALVGTNWSSQNFALAPLINEAKIPTLIGGTNPGLTRTGKNPWFYRIRPDDSIAATAATKFAVEQLKAKKVGIIYEDDQFGAGGYEIVKATLKQFGLELVAAAAHPVTDKDLSSPLLAMQKAGADAIIAWEAPGTMALVVKQKKQLGVGGTLIGSPAIGLPATAGLLTDDDMDGVYGIVDAVPDQDPDPKVQAWMKRYKEKYGAVSGPYGVEYYDGTMMLLNAIKAAGTDPAAIMKNLTAVKGYKGIATTYTSDKWGNATHSVGVVKFAKKTPKVITTISLAPEM